MALKSSRAKPAKGRARTGDRPKRSKTVARDRFVIREVQVRDLDGIHELAAHLNSVNIPHDPKVLRNTIRRARQGFTGKEADPTRRQYMFVLQGITTGHIGGTSTIYAQHGHPEAPHVFFDVIDDERYSSTLDRHFSHVTLRLGFNYRGPTEIGALVLDPELRAMGLGKALSFIRFLFMAMYRDRFRSKVIAELMPPLENDGRSRLWEHLGRHFTGLDYQEADKLSHHNKEFIYALFPQSPLYTSLLPDDVRSLIGQVGPETQPVRRMLEEIGFRYSRRIDPFDGGPHFEARIDELPQVREARRLRLASTVIDEDQEQATLQRQPHPRLQRQLVAVGEPEGPTRFRALVAAVAIEGGTVLLSKSSAKLLQVKPGEDVWTTVL